MGVLGCGPISQFAHLDAIRKARNGELYAICDVAEDLVARMAAQHEPRRTYLDYDAMLADGDVDAVLIATTDAFHVPLALRALAAGKHVFVEKPLGLSVEECDELAATVAAAGLVLQVGNNRRFDPGLTFAHRFIRDEIGGLIGFKGWYRDSTVRYTMTDNLQPIPVRSAASKRPETDPKADRERYFLYTHGSHLVDTARFLAGDIETVSARLSKRFDSFCWFIDAEFATGTLGHLELTIPIRGDMEEGFQVWGEHGSAVGRSYLPWFHKSSDVECFSTRDGLYRRPLGADAYSYKLQIEGFADAIAGRAPQLGASAADGAAAVRALVAISRSVASGGRCVRLADVTGAV
jgi:predicted dehydrogenase